MLLAENKNRISQFEISTSKMEKPKETQKDKKTIISKILILLTSLTLCYLVYQILQVSSINQDKILLEKENIKLLKYINTQPNNQIFLSIFFISIFFNYIFNSNLILFSQINIYIIIFIIFKIITIFFYYIS